MFSRAIFLYLFLFLAICMEAQAAPKPIPKPNYDDFYVWLEGYKVRAASAGIDPSLLAQAFAGQTPDSSIIKLDNNQPDKKFSLEEYLDMIVTPARIKKGQIYLNDHREILGKISAQFSVEPEFIVALWGLETSYGKNTGGFEVINALMTLAYDGRRRELFERELLNALKIVQDGHVSLADMTGSWAGAMGQCQFMPTSFVKYAYDYNGDGKRDIWNTEEDIFASIANYLATVGWKKTHESKEKALLDWNKSAYFVASVFKLATELGYVEDAKN